MAANRDEGNGVAFDASRYYRHAELVATMRAFAGAYPALAEYRTLGRSPQGRELPLLVLGNRDTGPADGKPGFYVEANTHAGEPAGTTAALYTAWRALTGWGHDPALTDLLDTRTLYVYPRVDVDGAELYLTTPELYAYGARVHPPDPPPAEGLRWADLDGDGLILELRVRDDADGAWRPSARDDRLMVPRGPDERGGAYYHVYPEGLVEGHRPGAKGVPLAPPLYRLNLNRNYPAGWAQEHRTAGSGRYPLSEPETRAVADFLLDHPNICGVQSFHTWSRVICRPFCDRGDDAWDAGDLALYQEIGARGTALTGYPLISVYNDFTPDKDQARSGVLIDWTYEHLGLIGFTNELWDLAQEAGVTKGIGESFRDLTEDEGLAMLRWNDAELEGTGFVPWRPFEHPQFGPVEIGGWRIKDVKQNPPGRFLAREVVPNAEFTLLHAGLSPLVRLDAVEAVPLGGGAFRVVATVGNHGYLGTQITNRGARTGLAKPVVAELTAEEGVTVEGQARHDLGHLEGRHAHRAGSIGWGSHQPHTAKTAEWLVRLTGERGTLRVVAGNDRGGRAERRLTLPER